jgi:hypothetical protein
MHSAADHQFSRVVSEFAQWRAVPEAERSRAPGWWWQPAAFLGFKRGRFAQCYEDSPIVCRTPVTRSTSTDRQSKLVEPLGGIRMNPGPKPPALRAGSETITHQKWRGTAAHIFRTLGALPAHVPEQP